MGYKKFDLVAQMSYSVLPEVAIMTTISKTATVRARIEPNLKTEVESLFKKLGLSTTEAINLFYRQVKLRKGLPFSVVIPNETTEKVFKDTDAGRNLIRCDDADDMFDKLGL